MKRWILGASAALLLGIPSVVWANARAPAPPPSPLNMAVQPVKVVVVVDDTVREPRLEVPQGLLLNAGRPVRGADAGPRMPFFFAGLALAGAFVFGGLWLSRRARTTQALVVALGLLTLGAGTLIADIRRPPTPKPPAELALPAGVQLPAKLNFQVTEKGDTLKLIMPGSMVLKADRPLPKPGE